MKRGMITMLTMVGLVVLALNAFGGDKPTIDLKWYGYFKLDGAYDRNMTSHGNFIMWVQPRTNPEYDNQFNLTANETRFGFNAVGTGYENLKVNGKLEFDLFASITGAAIAENKPMLQLRHAYFSVEKNGLKLVAGQTWDLISPLNPSTLNYSVLWGSGNIGYRRPQVSFWYNFKSGKQTDITLATGFFRTIGNDLTPTFTLSLGETAEGADDGTDAGIPSYQGLIDVKKPLGKSGNLRCGVSGHWGRLKAETNQGNFEKYESWVLAGHLALSPSSKFGFSGEIFRGANLGSYFGGILRNSEVKGLTNVGGWVATWIQASPKVQLNAGYGVDDPDNADFTSGRSRNNCTYGNIRYSFVPQATVGVEFSHWRTCYKNADSVKDFRAQTSLILSF